MHEGDMDAQGGLPAPLPHYRRHTWSEMNGSAWDAPAKPGAGHTCNYQAQLDL